MNTKKQRRDLNEGRKLLRDPPPKSGVSPKARFPLEAHIREKDEMYLSYRRRYGREDETER